MIGEMFFEQFEFDLDAGGGIQDKKKCETEL